jgi:hypothetical protein
MPAAVGLALAKERQGARNDLRESFPEVGEQRARVRADHRKDRGRGLLRPARYRNNCICFVRRCNFSQAVTLIGGVGGSISTGPPRCLQHRDGPDHRKDFMLYTFEHLETGDLRSAVATNEAAARFQLGGIWTDVERTTAFEPRDIDGLPAIFREAQAAEAAARQEMMAANPMGKARLTTPEALKAFTVAEEKHRKLQARREELMRLMVAAGQ